MAAGLADVMRLLTAVPLCMVVSLPAAAQRETPPGNYSVIAKRTTVPDFSQATRNEATQRAAAADLRPAFIGSDDPGARVARQLPAAGTASPVGGEVQLRMVAPLQRRVPDFAGRTRREAIDLAARFELRPQFDGAPGADAHVGGQQPAPGTPVHDLSPVALTMVAAPAPLLVPDFRAETRGEAQKNAQGAGLQVVFAGSVEADARVNSQVPPAGETALAGAEVRLQMVAAPVQIRVPDFLQRSRDDAAAEAKDFHVAVHFGGARASDAHVGAQSPQAGSLMAPGAEIELTMAGGALTPVGPPANDSSPGPPVPTTPIDHTVGGTSCGSTHTCRPAASTVAVMVALLAAGAWAARRWMWPPAAATVRFQSRLDPGTHKVWLAGEPKASARAFSADGDGGTARARMNSTVSDHDDG